jgi:protocatechuate 3,4-dioxygenase beta subunit
VDEPLNRSDLRSEPSAGSVQEGVAVRLAFHVSRIAGHTCPPLKGAVGDVWPCDARGRYSDVEARNHFFDTRGKQCLRGAQTTDAHGSA